MELLDSIDFDIEDVGKTVFLSREEALKVLKEREIKCDQIPTAGTGKEKSPPALQE